MWRRSSRWRRRARAPRRPPTRASRSASPPAWPAPASSRSALRSARRSSGGCRAPTSCWSRHRARYQPLRDPARRGRRRPGLRRRRLHGLHRPAPRRAGPVCPGAGHRRPACLASARPGRRQHADPHACRPARQAGRHGAGRQRHGGDLGAAPRCLRRAARLGAPVQSQLQRGGRPARQRYDRRGRGRLLRSGGLGAAGADRRGPAARHRRPGGDQPALALSVPQAGAHSP